MIGILVLTHGDFAKGLASAVNLITGDHTGFETIGLYQETNIEDYRKEVEEKIIELDDGNGVIILCDLFGATPYNITAQVYSNLKNRVNYKSITGVNLPMVIEALMSRENANIDSLTNHILDVGKDSVKELFRTVKGD